MTNILFCLLATVSDDSRYELHNETVNKYYDVVKELCRRKAETLKEKRLWKKRLQITEKPSARHDLTISIPTENMQKN